MRGSRDLEGFRDLFVDFYNNVEIVWVFVRKIGLKFVLLNNLDMLYCYAYQIF